MRFSPTREAIERAKALRGEGDLLALSHLAPIRGLGQAQAQRAQAVIDAREVPQGPISLGLGTLYDPNTGQTTVPEAYRQQQEAMHRRALELAQQRALSAQGQLSAGQEDKLAGWDAQIQHGYELLGRLEGTDAVSPGKDILLEGINAVAGAAVKNLTEEWLRSDEGQAVRKSFQRFMAQIRKSELGAALTGFELESAAEWSPVASGISRDESARRMQNILHQIEIQRQTLLSRTGQNAPPTGTSSAGSGLPPAQAGGLSAPEPQVQDRRTINGRSYILLDGTWFEE